MCKNLFYINLCDSDRVRDFLTYNNNTDDNRLKKIIGLSRPAILHVQNDLPFS